MPLITSTSIKSIQRNFYPFKSLFQMKKEGPNVDQQLIDLNES